jgi:hypothetical protein
MGLLGLQDVRCPASLPSCCGTSAWPLSGDVPLAAVGKVNSIGNDYISMLVMGVFNAVIEAESIRKEFKCNFTVGCCSAHTAAVLLLGAQRHCSCSGALIATAVQHIGL